MVFKKKGVQLENAREEEKTEEKKGEKAEEE